MYAPLDLSFSAIMQLEKVFNEHKSTTNTYIKNYSRIYSKIETLQQSLLNFILFYKIFFLFSMHVGLYYLYLEKI